MLYLRLVRLPRLLVNVYRPDARAVLDDFCMIYKTHDMTGHELILMRLSHLIRWIVSSNFFFLCRWGRRESVSRADHSATPFRIRCLDVEENHAMKNRSWRAMAIVEGPGELPTWKHILSRILQPFARHDPAKGMKRWAFGSLTWCAVV